MNKNNPSTITNSQIDALLRPVIDQLEVALPDRIRAYYLLGSYVDGCGRSTSDLDLCLVSKGALPQLEQEQLRAIQRDHSLSTRSVVDIAVLDESVLLTTGHFKVKHASRFLLGDDIRERMPDMTLESYLHYYSVALSSYFAQVLRNVEHITYPLSYPDATREFYGYDQPYLPPTGIAKQNIKGLVSAACWSATILVGWYSGKMVPAKSASVRMYQELVGDEWASFLVELYEWGSIRWQYLIPEDRGERLHLRDLCNRMLAFENHSLEQYRAYLLAQLRGNTECVRSALRQLSVVRFTDEECYAVVQAVAAEAAHAGRPEEPLREEARRTLSSILEAREANSYAW